MKMNMQQGGETGSSSNGGHNQIDRDTRESQQSSSRNRLIYISASLIGHQVEVQVLDGSVFSGILHAINGEDYGVILKMAYTVKNGSQGSKSILDSPTKAPSKTMIIPATDLVQIVAKGVPVIMNGFMNEVQGEKQQELLIDSCISQSRHVEVGKELERWVPDEDDPGCPELENIFNDSWNRGWDQFEVNKTLFGVKSTFDEELYTTKLERGPQIRALEREALKISREIEGEETLDLHLAEERGVQVDGNIEMDEETRFSSVLRPNDDSGYDEIVDNVLESRNDEAFRDNSGSVIKKTRKSTNRGKTGTDVNHSGLLGHAEHPATSYPEEKKEMPELHDQSQVAKADVSDSLNKESCPKVGLSPNASEFDPSHVSSKGQDKESFFNESEGVASALARTSSSASSSSNRGGATTTSAICGLSRSSSISSFSSQKSTLNPHAKEFKPNPNAKSFVPFQIPRRPSPVANSSSFYYPANMNAAMHTHGMPAGGGVGPSFAARQPVMFSPQAVVVPIPRQYYHPNGYQYGQLMNIAQPQPVFYMPMYSHERQFN